MSHDLIISLRYQLVLFQCFYEQLNKQVKNDPSKEELELLIAKIRQQRKIKNRLVAKAKLIGEMGSKPSINLN